MLRVDYSSNNSGGRWWLTDEKWRALEAAGWRVEWFAQEKGARFRTLDADGRWLGALASSASLPGATMREAIRSFESVTGCDAASLGCACCGPPHSFTLYDGDKWVNNYSPSYPSEGESYEGD